MPCSCRRILEDNGKSRNNKNDQPQKIPRAPSLMIIIVVLHRVVVHAPWWLAVSQLKDYVEKGLQNDVTNETNQCTVFYYSTTLASTSTVVVVVVRSTPWYGSTW